MCAGRWVALSMVLPLLMSCQNCVTANLPLFRAMGNGSGFSSVEDGGSVRLQIEGLAELRLGLCERERERFVCAFFRVKPESTAEFEDGAFLLSLEGAPAKRDPFPMQIYKRYCSSGHCPDSAGEFENELAGREIRSRSTDQLSNGYMEYLAVGPALSFRGMPGRADPPAWRLFLQSAGWHEFTIQLFSISEVGNSEVTLTIPAFRISGKEYEAPPIAITNGPRRACYPVELI